MAMLHFIFGAIMGVLFGRVFKLSLTNITILMVVSGVWALIPDVCQVYSDIQCSWTHTEYASDVFWLHGILDKADPYDNQLMSIPFIIILIISIISLKDLEGRIDV